MTQRTFFAKWKINQIRSNSVRLRVEQVKAERVQRLLKKSIVRWTRKLANLQARKRKARIGLWARVTVREIAFSRIQLLRGTILERGVFDRMKARVQMHRTFLKKDYFKRWRVFVRRTKQGLELRKLTASFALSRAFGRWKFLFENREEERQIGYVTERVVDPSLKRRTFKFWLDRAVSNFRQNQVKAIRYRKLHLKHEFFWRWRQYGIKSNRIANAFYQHGLLRRTFGAFRSGTTNRMDGLQAIAYGFRYELLKRRYFYRFRMLTEGKHLQEDMDEVISLLNGPVQLRCVRRL
jgi:hypothetical protein